LLNMRCRDWLLKFTILLLNGKFCQIGETCYLKNTYMCEQISIFAILRIINPHNPTITQGEILNLPNPSSHARPWGLLSL
jgi:hypothetical protein